MKEHWVVRNNTGGRLSLPKIGLSFREKNDEKELCFLTGKTIDELEVDSEICVNLKYGNLITVSKEKVLDKSESLINEINSLKEIIKEEHENRNKIIKEPQETPIQQIDMASLIEAIKSEIKSNLSINSTRQVGENIVSIDNDEAAREKALHQLLFKGKDTSVKSFEKLGSETQIDNEGEGNENLLEGMDL